MTRIQFCFERKLQLAYISHLDMLRLFLRALRRSGLPLAYSQGFNPRPRLTLALPLPLGVTAGEEYAEIFLGEEVTSKKFIELLRPQLPEGLEIRTAFAAGQDAPSPASLVSAALYLARLERIPGKSPGPDLLQAALENILAKEEILISKKTKKNKITSTNIRPFILEARLETAEEDSLTLSLLLKAGSQGGVSPAVVLEQIGAEAGPGTLPASGWALHRERLFFNHNGILKPLSEGM
jgi:radical SAM-linked protein